MSINQIIGIIFMGVGSIFFFLGGLGVFRMPDVFNRLQAGTKATTLGAISFTLGAGIFNPAFLVKAIVLVIFIAFTNPIGSSVLAKSAYNLNIAKVKEDGLSNVDKSCKQQ